MTEHPRAPIAWQSVADPAAFVRDVLDREAADIPPDLIEGAPWSQHMMLLSELSIDEALILDHDGQPVHRLRRDRFTSRMMGGEAIPPLIALGSARALVDGYARLRALRLLGVEEAAVLIQETGSFGRTEARKQAEGFAREYPYEAFSLISRACWLEDYVERGLADQSTVPMSGGAARVQ